MNIVIRHETSEDFRKVEEITKEAFWNLYVPGCNEHYLVHLIRQSKDYMPELSFVAVVDGDIAGHIMYTKAFLTDKNNVKHDILSFGPLCVSPKFQRRGIGKALINHSKKVALEKGHKGIVIFGFPHDYCSSGFKNAIDFNISDSSGSFPHALLACELFENSLNGICGKFEVGEVYNVDENEATNYDESFPKIEKAFRYSQVEFNIAVRSILLKGD